MVLMRVASVLVVMALMNVSMVGVKGFSTSRVKQIKRMSLSWSPFVSWYDLSSFLFHLLPLPSLTPPLLHLLLTPSNLAFHLLHTNSEAYLCSYAMSTVRLPSD